MKLTIEHLAAYLPYELKGISREENLGIELVKGYSTYGKNNQICLTTNVDDIDIDMFQPLLRPLSDLTKEIEHNGERFVPIDWFQGHEDIDYFDGNIWLEYLFAGESTELELIPYGVITKLLSWHFDIYSLIPQGLAIPIKTIDNEQQD